MVSKRQNNTLAVPKSWESPISSYLAFLGMRNLSPRTIGLYKAHLAQLARATDKPPHLIQYVDLLAYIGQHDWSPSTHNSFRATANGFYAWMMDTEQVTVSPAAKLPKAQSHMQGAKPVPDDVYRAALAKASPRDRLMLQLAGELGLRCAEIADVKAKDIIESANGRRVLKVVGKGSKTRYIPLPEWIAKQLYAASEIAPGEYCFPSQRGAKLEPHSVSQIGARLLPEGYSMHKLRHRALTRIYEHTKDLILTAELAGHSNVETTRKHYVKPDLARLHTAVLEISREPAA